MGTRFKTLDPWLFIIPTVLMGVGSVVIYVLTADDGLALTIRQLVYVAISLLVLILVPFFDYRNLRGLAPWFYGIGSILLGLVPIIGKEEFGAKLWIDFGFIQFQPGEVMKLFVLLLLSALLSLSFGVERRLPMRRFFGALALFLIPTAFIFLQPDFGTAAIIGVSSLVLLLHAPLSRTQKLLITAGLLSVVLISTLALQGTGPFGKLLKPYQRDRLVSFIDPIHDTSGAGYNVAQAVIAVGSGGITGTGLGFGTQSQLRFVPVAHADFIFASITEAWGWVGSLVIVSLLSMLVLRCLHAASIAKDALGRYLCLGIAAKILFEMLVNIGMNIRIMPVTGIPLPFLSYGGTALLVNALCMALVQSVVLRYKRLTF